MFEKRKLFSISRGPPWFPHGYPQELAGRGTYFVTRKSAYRQSKIALIARPAKRLGAQPRPTRSLVGRLPTPRRGQWIVLGAGLMSTERQGNASGHAEAPAGRDGSDFYRLARLEPYAASGGSRIRSWIACVCRGRPRLPAPRADGPRNGESG